MDFREMDFRKEKKTQGKENFGNSTVTFTTWEEEEEEEEDLFVFNDTIEGPRAPAVKPGRGTLWQARGGPQCLETIRAGDKRAIVLCRPR